MEITKQTDREENFLLMSFGFIMCALIFIICGQPLSRDNHLENITNIFILVIAMYVILSLHILHPTQWGAYIIPIIFGYMSGKFLMKFYYKDN